MIHLDHRDSRPIYDQIADNFRRQIRAGVLRCGDKLPSVRELSAQLTINPNTIQRAYRELEQDGWIESTPGKGSFVRSIDRSREEKLLNTFDETVRELLERGITTEELIRRITGGGSHA